MSAYATGGLSAMGLCTSSPNTVYLGTKSGVVLKVDSLQRTSAIVKTVTGTDMPKGAYVSNITVDPLDNASVFVTFSNYEVLSVFHSTDAGSTWECISGNLEEKSNGLGAGPSCRWLEVLHFNGDTLYLLATSSGVFSTHTLDAMNTVWEQFRAIPNVACTMIDVRSTDGFVAVATHGLGMFTTYAIGGGNSSSVQSLDLTFSALGVYPQPATGSMTIRCRLQRDAELSFCIRDVSGRSLLTTPASWFSAGEQLIPVDVSTLAQGWYSLELRAPGRRSPVAIGFIKQ